MPVLKKPMEEMDDKLCKYCQAKDMKMTIHSIGCEGNWCKTAYENYLETEEEE